MPILTVFAESPDRDWGRARGMWTRWTLEKVGQICEVRRMTFAALSEASAA